MKGLRLYVADRDAPPVEMPPPAPGRYWSRRGLAEWLVATLAEERATLAGIDHAFSFPREYFERHGLAPDWGAFLEDFRSHWPTDRDDNCVEFVRGGVCGDGAARGGNSRWRRLAERRTPRAKSVFHFDVPGSVAKSTHAGLPWLLRIREAPGARVHFWPFDGWAVPRGRSALAEVYPSLWRGRFPAEERTPDQQDAYAIAAWMRERDRDGTLGEYLEPGLTEEESAIAAFEGWILGVR